MSRLFMLIASLTVPSLCGTAVIAVLVMGYGTLGPILIAAAAGVLPGLIAAWVISRALIGNGG